MHRSSLSGWLFESPKLPVFYKNLFNKCYSLSNILILCALTIKIISVSKTERPRRVFHFLLIEEYELLNFL